MTMKLALTTQRDLLQQSNVEVPNDAYIVVKRTTSTPPLPPDVRTTLVWDSTIIQYRISQINSTQFTVPDDGFYMITLDLWYSASTFSWFNLVGGYVWDVETLGATNVNAPSVTKMMYLLANNAFSIIAQPLVSVSSQAILNRPLLKIKKVR